MNKHHDASFETVHNDLQSNAHMGHPTGSQ